MTRDPGRLAAFEQLLALPDERDLKTRGHRRTQTGKRERFVTTWLPAVRLWTERTIGQRAGMVEGWIPATTVRKVLRMR